MLRLLTWGTKDREGKDDRLLMCRMKKFAPVTVLVLPPAPRSASDIASILVMITQAMHNQQLMLQWKMWMQRERQNHTIPRFHFQRLKKKSHAYF